MKICVLIPSEDYRAQAGARIRYSRISAPLIESGHSIILQDISQFDPETADHDTFIISKCHDAQSLICAHILSARGKVVGVDLFDDYFSHFSDGRFTRFRLWLTALIETVDFVMCSTPAMAGIARRYSPNVPIHVMNDPADNIRPNDIGRIVDAKLTEARKTRTLKLAWFGVGDNPHFQVGLSDLAAHGRILGGLQDSGWTVSLTILTNRRAMTPDGLAQLRRISVPFSIEEWSEMREQALLDESLICFLPVNAQNFSIVKSLNRAVSALTSGCQVLSNGYPLYAQLNPLIYDGLTSLLDDLDQGELRLGTASIDQYISLMHSLASRSNEAAKLMDFLKNRQKAPPMPAGKQTIAVLHGVATSGAAHDMAKKVDGLSIASPFCTARLAFDAVFRYSQKGEITLLVADKALHRLKSTETRRTTRSHTIANQTFWTLEAVEVEDAEVTSISEQLTLYAGSVQDMQEKIACAFDASQIIVSENSPLPFRDLTIIHGKAAS
ncbi:hypothetical protein KFK14_14920 [Sphingobium phenoxybenzoativorans]|uniref:Uncharacterized protein n=1 Tax=Sphingobium phenoxybenzoativorans TaxID=1592790 RepID=A0A975K3T7_9SPHN|nr:hypothetical protein [Sphingobium phenoxybenzoativorans]QUT04355.1 hypothetical protein KFK14_14920 [Sphingobium phenoxybenzoativorans]